MIAALELSPLPREGGFFRQTWTSRHAFAAGGHDGQVAASAIYFLLTSHDFSALHRLRGDEVWLFHGGDPVEHVQLDPATAGARTVRLGGDVLGGELPQCVVPAGTWQGARLAGWPAGGLAEEVPCGWALLSCIMAPAWDERDFELGERAALERQFPAAEELIRALTR